MEDKSDTLYTNEIEIPVNQFEMKTLQDMEDISDTPYTSKIEIPQLNDYADLVSLSYFSSRYFLYAT